MAQRPIYKALEISLISLNVADIVTTSYGLKHGAVELNGAMKSFVDKPYKMVLVKAVTLAPSLYLLRQVYKDNPKAATISLVVLNSFYAFVVTNNIQVTLKIKI